jgi:hypothetical protein
MEKWKESLRQGSFRGIEFFTEQHSVKTGKRNISHQYPGSNKTENEDLGKETKEFSFSAYLVGEEYFYYRDKFIKLSESNNTSGLLIHPYLGNIRCKLVSVTTSESISEGRVARLELSFIEDEDTVLTYTEKSLKEEVYTAIQQSKTNVNLLLQRIYDINSVGLAGAKLAIKNLQGISDSILGVKASLSPFGEWRKSIDTAIGKLNLIGYSAIALGQYLEYIFTTGSDVKDRRYVLLDMYKRRAFTENSILNTRLSQNLNYEEWDSTPTNVQNSCSLMFSVLGSCALLSEYQFKSIEEAEEQRNDIYDMIDLIMSFERLDEELYSNFYDIKGLIESIIEEALPNLGKSNIYHIPDTGKPSLAVIQDIHKSIDKENELYELNSEIINPWFFVGDIKIIEGV